MIYIPPPTTKSHYNGEHNWEHPLNLLKTGQLSFSFVWVKFFFEESAGYDTLKGEIATKKEDFSEWWI